jgi:hypothetical protein
MAEGGRRHRRRACALGALAGSLVAGTAGGIPGAATPAGTARATAPAPVPELPLGGRRIFPEFRVVAFAGHPHADGLGALGIGNPSQAVRRLTAQARRYSRPTRPALPALALIATVAQRTPGRDGLYRKRASAAVIDRYLRAARRARALLLLDIQPGRSDFVREVRRLRPWLGQPDVGVALDPEWRLSRGQVPGVVGSVGASEVNAVSAELQRIVQARDLPEKLLVLHQFHAGMLRHKQRIARRPGVATVVSLDGIGNRRFKLSEYHAVTARPSPFYNGIKLFFREDFGLIRPRTILALRPPPDFILYE